MELLLTWKGAVNILLHLMLLDSIKQLLRYVSYV